MMWHSMCIRVVHAAWVFSAFSVSANAADGVLVHGAGVSVTAADVQTDAQRLPPDARKAALAMPANVTQLAQGLYLRRALAQEAQTMGLAADPEVELALRIARERVLSDAWLAKLEAEKIPAPQALDSMAMSIYRANPKRFTVPEQVRARHILLRPADDAQSMAEKLLTELKGGADFVAMAQKYSADTSSAAKGGDLGFFGRDRMVPEFDKAVFSLTTPGELSGVVKTEFGFHIIKLEEVRPAGLRPFEEVRDTLRRETTTKITNDIRMREHARVLNQATVDKAAIEAYSAAVQ